MTKLTQTQFALTGQFKKKIIKSNILIKDFSEKYKTPFLNIVEIINNKYKNKHRTSYTIFFYFLSFLKNRKETTTILMNSVVKSSRMFHILNVSKIFEEVNKNGSDSSVFPGIIAHSLLSVIQPYSRERVSVNPLKKTLL